jgi:hypothetical protein
MDRQTVRLIANHLADLFKCSLPLDRLVAPVVVPLLQFFERAHVLDSSFDQLVVDQLAARTERTFMLGRFHYQPLAIG